MLDELNMTKEIILLITGGAIGLFSSLATTLAIRHICLRTPKRDLERQHIPPTAGLEKGKTVDAKETNADFARGTEDAHSLTHIGTDAPLETESINSFASIISLEGTNITLADKREKAVEDLEVGMELLAYDNRMLTNTKSKIIEIHTDEINRHIVINDVIKLTEANRVDTDKGIQDAFAVSAGDAILRQDNLYMEVKKIQLKYGKTGTYTIKLENGCGIFAEKYCLVDSE